MLQEANGSSCENGDGAPQTLPLSQQRAATSGFIQAAATPAAAPPLRSTAAESATPPPPPPPPPPSPSSHIVVEEEEEQNILMEVLHNSECPCNGIFEAWADCPLFGEQMWEMEDAAAAAATANSEEEEEITFHVTRDEVLAVLHSAACPCNGPYHSWVDCPLFELWRRTGEEEE